MIEELIWDSNFFKRKTGRVIISKDDRELLDVLYSEGKKQGYKLIYIFSELPLHSSLLKKYPDNYFESRITYTKKKNNEILYPINDKVRAFNKDDNMNDLYNISYEVGKFSRFRKDKRISENEFRRYYRKWVDNSVLGTVSDVLHVHKEGGKILGFITAKILGLEAKIELIGVEEDSQGMGIGKLLLEGLYAFLSPIVINTIDVVTQSENKHACRFYEKNGFLIKNKSWVYHFWL